MNCWQCAHPIDPIGYLCSTCGVLLPPRPNETHFERLGLTVSFQQDEDEIPRQLRKRQRALHPDRFVHRSDRERQFSLQHATALNDAHRIISNRQRRAEYMLSLKGLDLDREDEPIRLDPMFLMEVIEFREALDELTGSDAHSERSKIILTVEQTYSEPLNRWGQALDSDEGSVQQLGQWAAQLRYLQRILDHVADHGDGLDSGPLA